MQGHLRCRQRGTWDGMPIIHPRDLWVRGSNLTGGHNRLSCPCSADTALKPYLWQQGRPCGLHILLPYHTLVKKCCIFLVCTLEAWFLCDLERNSKPSLNANAIGLEMFTSMIVPRIGKAFHSTHLCLCKYVSTITCKYTLRIWTSTLLPDVDNFHRPFCLKIMQATWSKVQRPWKRKADQWSKLDGGCLKVESNRLSKACAASNRSPKRLS